MRTHAVLVALLAACGESGMAAPDAAPVPIVTIDAAMLADGAPADASADATAPDATEPDASPDAAPAPDAAPPGASVTFYDFGEPVAGARAFLFGPDGALKAEAATGADGTARFVDVAPGSSVTIGKVIRLGPIVATVLDVQPGDRIAVGDLTTIPPSATTLIAITIPALAGVTRVTLGAGCGLVKTFDVAPTGATLQLPAVTACKRGGTWGIAAMAKTSANQIVKSAIAHSDGSPTTLAVWTDVTRTDGLATLTAAYSNAPAGSNQVQMTFDLPYPTSTGGVGNLPVPSGRFPVRYVPGLLDTLSYVVDAKDSSFENGTLVRESFPAATDHSINIGARALPLPGAVAFDFGDAARPALRWPAPPDGIDMVRVQASWSRDRFYGWYVYAPAGTTAVQMPAFPPGAEELVPPAVVGTQAFRGEVRFVDIADDQAAGWDAVRQDPVRLTPARASYRTGYAP
jgi:hypothetical protein